MTVTPSSPSVELTRNITLFTTVTGVGSNNFTYQWRHNGNNITRQNASTLTITNVMESDSGGYDCIVTNQFGDTNTSPVVMLMITSELTIVW